MRAELEPRHRLSAPSLAGALCVLFDVYVVAMARAEDNSRSRYVHPEPHLALRLAGATTEVPTRLRASFISVERVRGNSVMSLSDGDALLPRIAKKMRNDIGAFAHALPTGRNLQPTTSRA